MIDVSRDMIEFGRKTSEAARRTPGFGFNSSRRDGEELFSGGKVRLAPTLTPDVRDSAQLFDSNTATIRERIQGRSRLGWVLEDIELFHCPIGFSFTE